MNSKRIMSLSMYVTVAFTASLFLGGCTHSGVEEQLSPPFMPSPAYENTVETSEAEAKTDLETVDETLQYMESAFRDIDDGALNQNLSELE